VKYGNLTPRTAEPATPNNSEYEIRFDEGTPALRLRFYGVDPTPTIEALKSRQFRIVRIDTVVTETPA